jgi:hypothetical protein
MSDSSSEHMTNDRYFRYEDINGKIRNFKIYSYKFEKEARRHKDSFREIAVPTGMIRLIGCLCGSTEWLENGRFINEYECNCCGQFIEAIADE